MKIDNLIWTEKTGWEIQTSSNIEDKEKVNIVFVFGIAKVIKENKYFNSLKELYPNAILIGGSSAGTIYQDIILDDASVVATALELEKSRVKLATAEITDIKKSFEIGKQLVTELLEDDLKHIIVLADTININGSMLVQGLNSISTDIPISGGILAEETLQFLNAYVIADAPAKTSIILAVGFYGEIKSYYGSEAGWDEFGTERTITKSIGNIVYKIDNKPALDLYKRYLGDLAADLPSSGLRFPLKIWQENHEDKAVIRTLMGIDEVEKSLTFVSDVPKGYKAKLMNTNIEGLIDGAENAIIQTGFKATKNNAYCLAVSCIGRRLILNQLTEEELVVIQNYIGDNVLMSGFYSYGEIAPFSSELKNCRFHNQTMTITILTEK
jgi:hypothetical protein